MVNERLSDLNCCYSQDADKFMVGEIKFTVQRIKFCRQDIEFKVK